MKLIISTIRDSVIGTFDGTPENLPDTLYLDAPDGFDMAQSDEWGYDGVSLVHDPLAATNRAKVNRISQVKSDAAKQIGALSWRIERATERERLGIAGESSTAVLLEREAIRRASSRCEAEVNAAMDTAAVQVVQFFVTASDRATPERISRVEFLGRFTDAEMQAFIVASKSSPALEAYLIKIQSAEGVVLTDASTIAGVHALEMAGLIATGRAAEVLKVSA